MLIESKEIKNNIHQWDSNNRNYVFHLIKYDGKLYLKWEEIAKKLIFLDFDKKRGFAEIDTKSMRGSAEDLFQKLSVMDVFKPKSEFSAGYLFTLRSDNHAEKARGVAYSINSLSKENPQNRLLDEIFEREANHKITSHANIANALRLLMKVSRDKSKVLPPPRGEQARGYWRNDAYYNLKVLKDKTVETPIERMNDVFKDLTKEDKTKIRECLEEHYKKKATIYNNGAIKSKVNQALYLLDFIRLEVGELPKTANSDMKKAFKAYQEIVRDSQEYEKPAQKPVIKGSFDGSEEVKARSNSYREATDEGRVRFDSRANVVHEVPRDSVDIEARKMHPNTKASIQASKQRRLSEQYNPQSHHISSI